MWETLTRFCRVQGEALALMSHGKIQPRAWRPGASGALSILCILSLRTSPGDSEQGTQSLAGVCVCVSPSFRYRNGFRHSEPYRAAPGVEARAAPGVEARGEQPRAWRPGASGALPILCPQSLPPFWGVSELRTQCLETVSGSVTPLSQVQGKAPAMVSHGNDSGPGGRGS